MNLDIFKSLMGVGLFSAILIIGILLGVGCAYFFIEPSVYKLTMGDPKHPNNLSWVQVDVRNKTVTLYEEAGLPMKKWTCVGEFKEETFHK